MPRAERPVAYRAVPEHMDTCRLDRRYGCARRTPVRAAGISAFWCRDQVLEWLASACVLGAASWPRRLIQLEPENLKSRSEFVTSSLLSTARSRPYTRM